MQFIDEAVIVVQSGGGGHGSVHFRREKFAPRGGPDGGDGGKGGDIILVADNRSRSLLDYHHRRVYAAQDGRPGMGSRKSGRDGAHLELALPPGTQVFDEQSGELLADLTTPGERVVLLAGGNGGWGNVHFATSTRQAPDRANPGIPSIVRTVRLELKLLADVALVGYPNAGKSSLIRAISASRARVADYPFTTLVPNLGVVRHGGRVFTIADIPGLIEGAADGAGLGTRFLRHVERCRVLLFVLSALDDDPPAHALDVLLRELEAFNPELLDRPRLYILSKTDLLGPAAAQATADLETALGCHVHGVSSLTGAGLGPMLTDLAAHFDSATPAPTGPYDPTAS